jgi:hypothetical protein
VHARNPSPGIHDLLPYGPGIWETQLLDVTLNPLMRSVGVLLETRTSLDFMPDDNIGVLLFRNINRLEWSGNRSRSARLSFSGPPRSDNYFEGSSKYRRVSSLRPMWCLRTELSRIGDSAFRFHISGEAETLRIEFTDSEIFTGHSKSLSKQTPNYSYRTLRSIHGKIADWDTPFTNLKRFVFDHVSMMFMRVEDVVASTGFMK